MWQKSSFCRFDTPQCVLVRGLEGPMVFVKDSKSQGVKNPTLGFTREEWEAFIDGVKAGDFDLKSENSADAEDQMEQV